MVDARDVVAVAARVMACAEWNGQAIELTGNEVLTYGQVAQRLGHLSG